MKAIMDLHTHTIASGHGYSTLQENIEEAMRLGLQYLGLSEHGPAMPGGPHPYFFSNYRCIPRQHGSLRLLCGVEVNIMDDKGGMDLEEWLLERMDYVIASMHPPCVAPGSKAYNTRASIRAMQNPYVKILGHPDDARYPLDYEELVRAAKAEGVALEVNNSSLHPRAPRMGAEENIQKYLECCMKHQVPIILGTDSHISFTIGKFDRALEIIERVQFPKELILNYEPENIQRLVNIKM